MLILRGLSVSIGGVELSYPDVQVPQGDVLLLRGATGRGKSTASLDDEAAAAALHVLSDTARVTQATLVIATHDRRVMAHLQGKNFENKKIIRISL